MTAHLTKAQMKRAIAAAREAGASSVSFDGGRIVVNLSAQEQKEPDNDEWEDMDDGDREH